MSREVAPGDVAPCPAEDAPLTPKATAAVGVTAAAVSSTVTSTVGAVVAAAATGAAQGCLGDTACRWRPPMAAATYAPGAGQPAAYVHAPQPRPPVSHSRVVQAQAGQVVNVAPMSMPAPPRTPTCGSVAPPSVAPPLLRQPVQAVGINKHLSNGGHHAVQKVAAAPVRAAPVVAAPPPPVPAELPQAAAPAWDAHLEGEPAGGDPAAAQTMIAARRSALGISGDGATKVLEGVEFVSLGCFCACSNALQLLGVRRHSYPFDWVRSSLDGIVHCIDSGFEDFLTYSTYSMQGAYVVFGGTRWGGSFWHHNVEVPATSAEMTRRAQRFFGRGEVQPGQPRLFVRVVNSTRELEDASRLRAALARALPEAMVFLLLVVDLQSRAGPMAVRGPEGHGIFFYTVSETETLGSLSGGPTSYQQCSETYARAVAYVVKHLAGESIPGEMRTFENLRQLGAACDQFDGGDPGRELFTPRKFYGQMLGAGAGFFEALFAKTRMQSIVLQAGTNPINPLHAECFGKRLMVTMPPDARAGQVLQIYLIDGALSASLNMVLNGALQVVGAASVAEVADVSFAGTHPQPPALPPSPLPPPYAPPLPSPPPS